MIEKNIWIKLTIGSGFDTNIWYRIAKNLMQNPFLIY